MNRRQFLVLSGASAMAMRGQSPADSKRKRIGISTWSFHTLFTATRDQDSPPLTGKPLDLLDYPEMIADRYHIHEMEIVAPHFASKEPGYIRKVKASLDRAHSHVVNIPVDIDELWSGGGLSDLDPGVRDKAISACKPWIDIAHDLGARSVRCDPGKINRSDLSATIASYKSLAAYGASKGIYIIIENHGGVGSEHPEDLVKIFEAAGPHAGALPDFGNFPDETIREKGLDMLFPHAPSVCHAKGLQFDASGTETAFDFPRCIAASKRANFKGVYSIEYEGPGDPYEGVQHVVDELVKYL
jgi:hypothetical protein